MSWYHSVPELSDNVFGAAFKVLFFAATTATVTFVSSVAYRSAFSDNHITQCFVVRDVNNDPYRPAIVTWRAEAHRDWTDHNVTLGTYESESDAIKMAKVNGCPNISAP